jgi:hypothetical protein
MFFSFFFEKNYTDEYLKVDYAYEWRRQRWQEMQMDRGLRRDASQAVCMFIFY